MLGPQLAWGTQEGHAGEPAWAGTVTNACTAATHRFGGRVPLAFLRCRGTAWPPKGASPRPSRVGGTPRPGQDGHVDRGVPMGAVPMGLVDAHVAGPVGTLAPGLPQREAEQPQLQPPAAPQPLANTPTPLQPLQVPATAPSLFPCPKQALTPSPCSPLTPCKQLPAPCSPPKHMQPPPRPPDPSSFATLSLRQSPTLCQP